MAHKKNETRDVAAEGFYHGAHDVPAEPAKGEIDARFEQEIHQTRFDAVDATKELEAQVAVLQAREPKVTAHWETLRTETGGHAPEVALPVFATMSGMLAIAGETLLLAPVMDGFGIADPAWQALAAGTFVLVASGLLHLALRRVQEVLMRENPGNGPAHRRPIGAIATVLLAVFALATTSVLGWWRAGEMIFAGNAQGGEWASFLGGNQLLTKVCVTLLTLGLPFFAAVSFEWGFARLRYALEWRRARREYARLVRDMKAATKGLEAVTEKKDHQIEVLGELKKVWLEIYSENYELGRCVGARQLSLWRVLLQIGAVILLLVGVCAAIECWLDTPLTNSRLLAYAALTLGIGGLYAYFALQAWERPTPLQLYKQRAVVWRLGSGPSPVAGGASKVHDSRTAPAANARLEPQENS